MRRTEEEGEKGEEEKKEALYCFKANQVLEGFSFCGLGGWV